MLISTSLLDFVQHKKGGGEYKKGPSILKNDGGKMSAHGIAVEACDGKRATRERATHPRARRNRLHFSNLRRGGGGGGAEVGGVAVVLAAEGARVRGGRAHARGPAAAPAVA